MNLNTILTYNYFSGMPAVFKFKSAEYDLRLISHY